jgi:aminopeptidase N
MVASFEPFAMNHSATRGILLLTTLAGLAASIAVAQPAGFDAATGTYSVVYPPHRVVDAKHMKLEITIPDMNVPKARAVQTLTVSPIRGNTATLSLDAKGLAIETVTCEGHATTFKHDGKTLTVTFEPALPEGKDASIVTTYRIDSPHLGLVWTPESPEWPGRAAQLHTQGQPQTNSYWFPCHDFPNEKLTTELIVTAPAGYEVSSNGRLVEKTNVVFALEREGGGSTLSPHCRWHYLQDKPHANYLVTLVVGKFDVVDIGPKGGLYMPVYAPVGRGKDVARSYGHTPEMIAHFSRILDEPFAWDKYAQLVVWNFGAGGMENTSATSMYDTAIVDAADAEDHDLDGLISHELGHQWFGDLITCNSWEHIWLNEGFATYMTTLWMEHRDGPGGYEQAVRGLFDGVCSADSPDAPAHVGMVSNVYVHPWEVFRRPSNPYGKGASILHMLRMKLGTDRFLAGVRAYIDQRKFDTAETYDFRRALEQTSGESLEQFFHQWCDRPGTPSITVTSAWSRQDKSLTLTVEQKQRIDAENPAFEFDLPVIVRAGATDQEHTISVRGRTASLTVPCDRDPACIIVDPAMHVLASIDVKQPEASFLAQFMNAPTQAATCNAIRGLRVGDGAYATRKLESFAASKSQPAWLRTEAVRSLAARGAVDGIRALATDRSDRWEVREALVNALVTIASGDGPAKAAERERSTQLLLDRAKNDGSLRVRCAAIKGLGTLKANEAMPLLLDALTRDSQSDELRQAALEALGTLDDAKALPRVLGCTRAGFDSRTRPTAIGIAAKLAHHDPDAAFAALSPLLKDREIRTARAAGEALVQMKHPKAAEAIKAAMQGEFAEELLWQSGQWLKALGAK